MNTTLSLGNIAYNAYCESTEWKSVYTGAALPQYDQQRPEVIQAWENSALAVISTVHAIKASLDSMSPQDPVYAYGAVNNNADIPTTDLSAADQTVNSDVDEESASDETYAIKA
jgi:hypothetical protein